MSYEVNVGTEANKVKGRGGGGGGGGGEGLTDERCVQ